MTCIYTPPKSSQVNYLWSNNDVRAVIELISSFSKIFRTKYKDVVDECMLLFGCSSVLTVVSKRKAKLLDDYL